MIDQRLLRTDLDGVKAALARRSEPGLLDEVDRAAELEAEARMYNARRDEIRGRINAISKQVGRLRRDGDIDAAEELQHESKVLGAEEQGLDERSHQAAGRLHELLLGIPNLPSPDAPDGASDAENPVVDGPHDLPAEFGDHQRVPHWETAEALGILDSERAVKISKSMFTMPRGPGATLARALCQYGLDLNADVHEEVRPPTLVSSATLTATGQLPKFAEDAFAVERDDLWCIPTAEVPLTSLFADEILDEPDLPIRVMASTPSYRREAGAAGRDTRGMLRAHEFDKVEILAFATPEQAPALLDDMVERSARAVAGLGLPYRVVDICTGDMGQSHHRSLDVEVFAPGADAWLEVSSVSWFSDYQARRANIRFRRHDADGKPQKGTEFVHTLNGSALAVPRVWAAILENFRNEDGSVSVPPALIPYMRGIHTIEPTT